METGEVENVTYLRTTVTSQHVLFGDLAMRCLSQWRSLTADEIPPARSECLHTTTALCLLLSVWRWGGEVFEFLLGNRNF